MECFGEFSKKKRCRNCIYAESCRWYQANPIKDRDYHAPISFSEAVESIFWEKICENPQYEEDETTIDVQPEYTVEHLVLLTKILNRLDKYTLKILGRLITVPDVSVAELAEWRGCSRQAIHEKLLLAAERYPFVACVFEMTARKVQETILHKIRRTLNRSQEEDHG